MANDLNLCQFIGRLGGDPEVRYMPDGKAVASIRIAVGSSWKNQAGEKQEHTEWVPITVYGKLAEIVKEHLRKGSKIYASGRFKTRKWQAQDGSDRYSTEIICDQMQMLDSKPSDGSAPRAGVDKTSRNQASQGFQAPTAGADFDDDIPFDRYERGQVV